jgi:iron only hydrogenase large subunit-like protein
MQTFSSLYQRLMKASLDKNLDSELAKLHSEGAYDPHQLDCLLNPEIQPPVVKLAKCSCADEGKAKCAEVCFFNAIRNDGNGNVTISREDCAGCGDCITACENNNLAEIKEAVPIFSIINEGKTPVYAMIAPAYISQFSKEVTPGKLRSAFKQLGFAGMIEVALFADILTLKEALEFDKSIHTDKDFLLTSCCCPMWIVMIKKVYRTLVPHLPPSVSPMVACGKAIKTLYKGAKTVFIGPCIAKKAEAREMDVADAVDYVLTFEEIRDILSAAGINPAELEEDLRDHSSKAGRRYAVTSGVSEAVRSTLNKLKPERDIPLRAEHADGIRACKEMLKSILEGTVQANFIEGMGCVGGCVGGPKSLIDRTEAAANVNEYGGKAAYETPIENPYVIELLKRLGFHTIDSLLESDSLFIRNFDIQ